MGKTRETIVRDEELQRIRSNIATAFDKWLLLANSSDEDRMISDARDEALALFDLGKNSQRQDSTEDQLRSLYAVAIQIGCYDAADLIKRVVGDKR